LRRSSTVAAVDSLSPSISRRVADCYLFGTGRNWKLSVAVLWNAVLCLWKTCIWCYIDLDLSWDSHVMYLVRAAVPVSDVVCDNSLCTWICMPDLSSWFDREKKLLKDIEQVQKHCLKLFYTSFSYTK